MKVRLKEDINLKDLKEEHWNGCQFETLAFLRDNYDNVIDVFEVERTTPANNYIIEGRVVNYKIFDIIEEDKKIRKVTLLGEEIKLGSLSNWLKDSTNNEEKIANCIECNAMKINEIIDKINEGE